MESHSLNLAQQQFRHVEALLMNRRYAEAMQCHRSAAAYLIDAVKSTKSSVALKSTSLQNSNHLKQKDLINNKKEQYARVKKSIDRVKSMSKDQILNPNSDEYKNLQTAIYKAINESEAVLFKIHHEFSLLDAGNEDALRHDDKDDNAQLALVKEYKVITQNLHYLIEQLILQVVVLRDENNTLREKAYYLENESFPHLIPPPRYPINNQFNSTPILRHHEYDPTGLSKPLNDLAIDTEEQQSG